MSRLYRSSPTESLVDVIVSSERVAEVMELERKKGHLAFAGFNTFSCKDERSTKGKWIRYRGSETDLPSDSCFHVFNGQGVSHPDWGWGVVQEESDDGRDCQVLFFDELVWMARQLLERITYPKPEGVTMKKLTEQEKGQLANCPKCSKAALRTTVYADGDYKHECFGKSCTYIQVWKSKERLAREASIEVPAAA